MRLLMGFRVTQALHTVAVLGVADTLSGGPRLVDDIAATVGADVDQLFRVMRALVAVGIFVQPTARTFALTALGDWLRDNGDHSLRYGTLLIGGDVYRAWGSLLHSIRTRQPAAEHVFHQPYLSHLASNPEAATIFDRALAEGATLRLDEVLQACGWREKECVVDVAGGDGCLLAGILERHRHLRGILFERPHLEAEARRRFARDGVSDRCDVLSGDMFEGVPAGGDVYIMSHVLHGWQDDQALRLIRNCRRVMRTGDHLIVADRVLEDRLDTKPDVWSDVHMLVMSGGRERTVAEWNHLFAQADLRIERIDLLPASGIVVARRD
jgi:SAM-dependent methyltransferase